MRIIVLSIALFCFAGCSRTVPEFRNLRPAKVVVVNGDRPLEGVRVSLTSKDPQSLRGCKGTTDATGTAIIRTYTRDRQADGAVPGRYIVVLGGSVAIPEELRIKDDGGPSPENAELAKKRERFLRENKTVPAKLDNTETSPLELIVEEGNDASLVVDVSKF